MRCSMQLQPLISHKMFLASHIPPFPRRRAGRVPLQIISSHLWAMQLTQHFSIAHLNTTARRYACLCIVIVMAPLQAQPGSL